VILVLEDPVHLHGGGRKGGKEGKEVRRRK
jgi:hypothetical protein